MDQTARILWERHKSDKIIIQGDVRQGCPLSPLLFNIVIEMLALAVCVNPNVNGVKIDNI